MTVVTVSRGLGDGLGEGVSPRICHIYKAMERVVTVVTLFYIRGVWKYS